VAVRKFAGTSRSTEVKRRQLRIFQSWPFISQSPSVRTPLPFLI